MKGWKISRDDRARLLERFPPVWPDVIADHVTMVSSSFAAVTTPKAVVGDVVGHVNDGEGLQALVVEIDGTTDRPDGSTFHITWSIYRARGREPKDSNEVGRSRRLHSHRPPSGVLRMTQLFLDCDGVLADFDHGAEAVLGMPPRAFEKRFGLPAFWARLGRHRDFYASLLLRPDARRLFAAVQHLNPIILTGCPRGGWAEAQKVRWAKEHFPGPEIITCMARNKRDHAQAGDVLVDNTLRHRHLWEEMGGIFIHHRSADETVAELEDRGILDPIPAVRS